MAEAVHRRIVLDAPRGRDESLASGFDRNLVFLTIAVALFFLAGSLFYVWAHHQAISLGYRISQASQEGEKLGQMNKRMRLELAALKSPRRIEEMALREGFVNPQKDQLIIVR
ncbi:MAG: cell division protein FtsL [Deltaproteobacteria bacterium]|nr:cell division protein FtsL [Deltaproteobacteria bacterium]